LAGWSGVVGSAVATELARNEIGAAAIIRARICAAAPERLALIPCVRPGASALVTASGENALNDYSYNH